MLFYGENETCDIISEQTINLRGA